MYINPIRDGYGKNTVPVIVNRE